MELRREEVANGPVITGFSGRGFRVGERVFEHGVMLDPGGVTEWTAPERIEQLLPEMLGALLDRTPTPEFLLLGTGARLIHPNRAFMRALEDRQIGLEVMDSRAAARAWGVLRQEDREVVAALLPHR